MTDETVFAVALEKPDPAERAAYLDSACAADPEQRRRVEGLLAALEAAGGFLEKPAVAVPDPDLGPTRDFHTPEAAGDGPTRAEGEGDDDTDDALGFLAPAGRPDSLGRIGHYEVLEVLGRGGFGIVFRAFDDVLQRVVAVKVLAPSIAATSPARKRFVREARSAAPIQHENVVRIHETGEEPLPYLVMEFVPGETLQDRLDRTGPLDVPEALRIARQVADGLAAAHEKGLIHRDIKPSNILIHSGPGQQVKITDFGLARAADDASLTRSGVVAGTPMYMAPEQAKGETLDHRADLFSLGSVLYAMLTGRPPFRAENTLAVLKRVAEDTPRPIREVIPEVPGWLCRVVEKLHAKDPADRFQTAREVADLLADCERQLAAHKELRDASRIPEAKEKARPARRESRSAVLLVVLLVGGLGLFALLGVAGVAAYLLLTPVVTEGHKVDPVGSPDSQTLAANEKPIPVPGWGMAFDPRRDCRFAADANGLVITVPGGHHNLNPAPPVTDVTAPRVLRSASGDFVLESQVEPFPLPEPGTVAAGRHSFVGAGLVCWKDARNFARFLRAANGESGRLIVSLEFFRDGQMVASGALDIPDGPTRLRVRRTGDDLQFSFGTDGDDWVDVSVKRPVRLGGRVEVGVAAVNATVKPFAPRFSRCSLQTADADDGFVPLFNGKNLTGWTTGGKAGGWRVADGVLVGSNGPSFLFTAGRYRDFHLRVEAKLAAPGNGGINFRETLQAELNDNLKAPTGSLVVLDPKKPATLTPYPHSVVPTDAWFTLEIRAVGPSVWVRVNNDPWLKKTVDAPDPNGSRFGLEVLPGVEIHFRKIEVKELPAPVAGDAPPPAVAPFDAQKAKEHQEAWAKHVGVPVEYTNSVGMKFRLIPPGEFQMGSTAKEIETLLADEKETAKFLVNAEGPQRSVRISSPYYMGTFEVTQAEYLRVMGVNPSDFARSGKSAAKVEELDTEKLGFPVENVSWDDATEFCRKLSDLPEEREAGRVYRLATEAQWEYACRAGTVGRFHTGDVLDEADANFNLSLVGRPQPVGAYPANAFGLHDMHGNVFEWCQDWFGADYRDLPLLDPQGPETGDARVVRGGNYGYRDRYCRSAARDRFQPVAKRGGIGFRVVIVGDLRPKPAAKKGPDPAAVQPLKDAVAAQTRTRDAVKTRFELGKVGKLELLAAEVDLTEARVKLAEAEGDTAAVVARLEELVKHREEERKLVKVRVDEGLDRAELLDQADFRLAQAKARLAKVKPPTPEVAPAPRPRPKE